MGGDRTISLYEKRGHTRESRQGQGGGVGEERGQVVGPGMAQQVIGLRIWWGGGGEVGSGGGGPGAGGGERSGGGERGRLGLFFFLSEFIKEIIYNLYDSEVIHSYVETADN